MKFIKSFFKILPLLLLLLLHEVHSDHQNEEDWIEPNLLARRAEHTGPNLGAPSQLQLDKGSTATTEEAACACTEDVVALVYYKKFIATLFNRKKLQYDNALELYQRSLLFTIIPAQLDKLEQLNDPRDLDIILAEILGNARTINKNAYGSNKESLSIAALFWDIFKDLLQLLRNSEVRFLLVSLSAILLCWFLHRRHKIGFIVMIFGGMLIFGYFITYLECNRKLEVEQMLDVLESKELPTALDGSSWFTPFTKWFYTKEPVKQQRQTKIKKHSKLNLGFCRPDHVLLIYANELFLKQLEILITKCKDTLVELKDGLSFPYNYFAGGMLLAMIAYIVKLTFKYILSPNAWASLLHRPATASHHYQQPPPLMTSGVTTLSNDDRISGENLKTLLNALSAPSGGGGVKPSPLAVSGVQEVLESLEAPPSSTSSRSSSKSNSPNTSMEAQQIKLNNENKTSLNENETLDNISNPT